MEEVPQPLLVGREQHVHLYDCAWTRPPMWAGKKTKVKVACCPIGAALTRGLRGSEARLGAQEQVLLTIEEPGARCISAHSQWHTTCTPGPGCATTLQPPPTMKTRGRRWLESASALYYVTTFLFLGAFSTILLFLLLFTSLWSISLFYFAWLYLDWDTPNQGGRCSTWKRNWTIWKYLRDYFPIKMVKTAELPPDRNYVMGAHPHGIMGIGLFSNFCTESNAFSQQFPGLRSLFTTLAGVFYLPIYREYLMTSGLISVDRQNLDQILSQNPCGQLVVIIVGGAQEALYSSPGQHCLSLLNRKGFVRLALRHGASLVPIYSFGENDIFNVKTFPADSWQYRCQMTFKKLVGFSPCIFFGQSIFSGTSWGLMPFRRPITTVVGRPIDVPQVLHPTEEDVDHYHTLYLKALDRLFEEHKKSCGVPADAHLTFL
ncbi:2-acylglycerol O-acyltransferase 3-like [Tenrec ecaudatus]|uniref:2-acylglycerol O-acyltransferase 3-like n=1 Tax=Tenrec ecaudatus TaxID=94439 RepID=UPI003F5A4370